MSASDSSNHFNAMPNPNVLVVDDETDIADMYASCVEDIANSVTVAYGGEDALEKIDESVDVVLLDRQMPDKSGDEVLEEIRTAGYDVDVIMVTAVEPDFDIVDMDFESYLVKSVSCDDLTSKIEHVLQRAEYDEKVQELFSVLRKKQLIEREKTEAEIRQSEAYSRLEDRIRVLRAKIDDTAEALLDGESEDTIRQLATSDGG